LSQIITGDETGFEAAVHGVEAHLITEKAHIQAGHFNLQDNARSLLG
jgi:hypothetical protein